MTDEEIQKRGDVIVKKLLSDIAEQLNFGKHRHDSIMLMMNFPTGSINAFQGDHMNAARSIVEMMVKNPQLSKIFYAATMLYAERFLDNEERMFYVNQLMGMIANDQEKEHGELPHASFVGFEFMPDEVKRAIAEAFSEEFKGYLKPNKEDVKPSDN